MSIELVQKIDSVMEQYGWDQPHAIFGIKDGVFVKIKDFLDHPIPVLAAMTQEITDSEEKTLEAVIMSVEGWTYPDNVFGEGVKSTREAVEALYQIIPPSKHPNRVEIRNVFCATKDGEFTFTKKRGGQVIFHDKLSSESQVEGPVPDALRAYAKKVLK